MNNNYQELIEAIKKTDPSSRNNNFTKLITIRTDTATKGNLKLISKQLQLPYSKIARFTVKGLDSRIPALTYKSMIEKQIVPNSVNNTTSIRFWVTNDIDNLIDMRAHQLKTKRQHLLNLVLNLFIEDYKKKHSEYLLLNQAK